MTNSIKHTLAAYKTPTIQCNHGLNKAQSLIPTSKTKSVKETKHHLPTLNQGFRLNPGGNICDHFPIVYPW